MITRQSTARTILVGPVLDSTGAAKTDEVVANIKVTKNGTVGAADGSATLVHNHAGKYLLALTANDCDTVGVLEISLNSGTNDMPVKGLNVVETAIWDALFADGATGFASIADQTSIKAKTDNLPSDPADQSIIIAATDAILTAVGTRSTQTSVDAIQSDTDNIQSRLPAALESGRIAAALDTATQDDITAIREAVETDIPATIASLQAASSTLVERSTADTNPITFNWPVSGAVITGTVSINNGTYAAVEGTIAFLRTESGKHYYTLAHDAADRPTAEGTARYKFVDGTYTRYVGLRVAAAGLDDGAITDIADAVLLRDWTAVTGSVPSRSTLNALRHIRNKWALDGTTKTVYAEDGTTVAFTTQVTADGAGNITADTPD